MKNIILEDLVINLVRHDTSAMGLPAYIEVQLSKMPTIKDRGPLVKDLGNYIYNVLGLKYQTYPEYRGRGKKTTVRWFMSWNNLEPIRLNILQAFNKESMIKCEKYLPFEFNSLIIQNKSRGVLPPKKP